MHTADKYKEYYQKNKNKILNYQKEYRKKSPNKIKNRVNKYCERNRNILKELKSNGCAICGYNENTLALQFHHTNPKDKGFELTLNAINYTDERIIKEINKCIILCCNCHKIIERGFTNER